jgi:hypothetical protein
MSAIIDDDHEIVSDNLASALLDLAIYFEINCDNMVAELNSLKPCMDCQRDNGRSSWAETCRRHNSK